MSVGVEADDTLGKGERSVAAYMAVVAVVKDGCNVFNNQVHPLDLLLFHGNADLGVGTHPIELPRQTGC